MSNFTRMLKLYLNLGREDSDRPLNAGGCLLSSRRLRPQGWAIHRRRLFLKLDGSMELCIHIINYKVNLLIKKLSGFDMTILLQKINFYQDSTNNIKIKINFYVSKIYENLEENKLLNLKQQDLYYSR